MSTITGTKPPRRTQEERRQRTRRALIDATIDTLIETGYANTTIALVAARAGLSRGALLHYFPSKGELIIGATEDLFAAFVSAIRERAERVSTSELDLGGFLDDCWEEIFKGRWFYASLQLISAARTEPLLKRSLQPAIQNLHRLLDEIWRTFFHETHLSAARIDTLLNMTLNLMRGMAVQAVLRDDPSYYRELLETWKDILPMLVQQPSTRPRRGARLKLTAYPASPGRASRSDADDGRPA